MAKPQEWIIYVTDCRTQETTEHPFTERGRARGFMIVQKAQGHTCRIAAKGF